MPKTLDGLLRWFVVRFAQETPEKLHVVEVWHDRLTNQEREEGKALVGGSLIGTHAFAAEFRLILEAPASVTDEDGYYLFPIRDALARLHRRWPFMARYLFRVGQVEGDWKRVADDLHWVHEAMEIYVAAALERLWRDTYDRRGH